MQSTPFELKSELVRAGAGAGKTTRLIQKVVEGALSYKKAHGSWPKLVVTTFTRKATQELKERLVVEACERKDIDLLKFVSSPYQLHISTLHGVFSQFLKKYAHLMGIAPGFNVITNEESLRIAKRILKEMAFKKHKENFSKLSNYYDFTTITDLCIQYSYFLIESPEAEFFSEEEHQEAFKEKCEKICESIFQVCDGIESGVEDEKWLSYSKKFRILSQEILKAEEDGEDYLLKLKSLGSKPRKNKNIPEEVNEDLDETLKGLKKELISFRMQKSQLKVFSEVSAVFKTVADDFCKQFEMTKKNNGQLSMSDLELYAYQATKLYPEVTACFSHEWDYWLIDEYQDTSPLQVEILKFLTGDKPQFVVGDPQQSIYLFRGARSEVFFDKEKSFKSSGREIDLLQKNYRSEPELLLFFNHYFQNIPGQFSAMEPRNDLNLDKNKKVAQINVVPVNTVTKDKFFHEKESLFFEIEKLISDGESYEDICILSRTNNDLLDISRFLSERNCPVHLHSSSNFFARREILDALALLKFLVNPDDNFNLLVLLRSPWFKVSDEKITQSIKEKPEKYWQEFKSQCSEDGFVKKLSSYLEMCSQQSISHVFQRAMVETGFFDMCQWQDPTGRKEANLWKLVSLLVTEEKSPGFNIVDFIHRATETKNLLEDGDNEGDAVAAFEPDCIRLMTVHASKGLQFKYVFIVGMHKKPQLTTVTAHKQLFHVHSGLKRWGLSLPMGDEQKISYSLFDRELFEQMAKREIEEFNRLLYVAMTRAKNKVYLSWVDKVSKDSWGESCPLDLDEGDHQLEYCTYSVSCGPWAIGNKKIKDTEKSILREKIKTEQVDTKKRFSVSSLIAEMEKAPIVVEDKKDLASQDYKEYLEKATKGSLVHKMMELLKYEENISDEHLKMWFGSSQEMAKKAINYVQESTNPPLKKIIESGYVEWGFQIRTAQGIMEGQIDLWGEVDGTLWLIDYKSGSQSFVDKAFQQLNYYAQAVERKTGNSNIKLAVVYPLAQKSIVRDRQPLQMTLS